VFNGVILEKTSCQ